VGSAAAAHSQANAIAAEDQYGTPHHVNLGMELKKLVLQAQTLWIHDVIAIHASEKLARSQADGFIQSGSEATILGMLDEPDARIAKPAHGFGGTVGRAVIDDDEFPIGKLLGEHGLDGVRHRGAGVPEGHSNADDRHGGECSALQ
jgi:hypothetical protein